MKIRNRRTENRVRLEINAKIGVNSISTDIDESLAILPCVISDISIGGVKIVLFSHKVVNPKTLVNVYVKTSNFSKPIELEGIVRWRHTEYGSPSQRLGIEFMVPEKTVLDRWLTYASSIIDNALPEDLVEDTSEPCPWGGVIR